MKRRITFIALILVIAAVSAAAQLRLPQASQKAQVMQAVGVTDVTITYFRPMVKDRTIWGDWPEKVEGEATLDNGITRPKGYPIVPYGHVWRTGANAATQFTVTDDVTINGQPLAAGTYSLHSIPGKDEWTIIFNKNYGQWGSFEYDAKQDALRVKTKPSWLTENQEALHFSIEPVSDEAATVVLRWEKLRVPFTLQVKEAVATTLAKARKAVESAKPDDFNTPWQAANYARDKKEMGDANRWYEQALKVADAEIAKGETYRGYARRFNVLVALGRTQDAVAAGEKAVALGKAATPKVDTATLEKRIADLKAGKM
jgi:hypothetical protein